MQEGGRYAKARTLEQKKLGFSEAQNYVNQTYSKLWSSLQTIGCWSVAVVGFRVLNFSIALCNTKIRTSQPLAP